MKVMRVTMERKMRNRSQGSYESTGLDICAIACVSATD